MSLDMNSFNPFIPFQVLSTSKSFHYLQLIRMISSAFLYCFEDFLPGHLWHWTPWQWPLLGDGSPISGVQHLTGISIILLSTPWHRARLMRLPCQPLLLDCSWLSELGKGVQMAFNQSEGGDGAAPRHNTLQVYKTTCAKHQRNSSYQRQEQGNLPWSEKPRIFCSQLSCRTPQKGEAVGGAVFGLWFCSSWKGKAQQNCVYNHDVVYVTDFIKWSHCQHFPSPQHGSNFRRRQIKVTLE